MSTPWNIIESLTKWSNLIKEHIKKLNLDDNTRNKLKDRVKLSYQNYQEPDENINNNNNNTANSTNSKTTTGSLSQVFSKKDSLNNNNTTNIVQQQKINDDDLVPLDPSVLTSNLGVETVVVLTKVKELMLIVFCNSKVQ